MAMLINEKIDKYLLGQLEEQEIVKLKAEISSDPNLKQYFEEQQKIQSAITMVGRQKLKNELKEIHTDLGFRQVKRGKRWKNLAILVVNLLALAIASFYLFGKDKEVDIIQDYYQPYQLALAQRGSVDQDVGKLIGYYESLKYSESKKLAGSLLLDNTSDLISKTQLYLIQGISQFELDEHQDAIKSMEQILTINDPFLNDQARWYMALIYLDQDKNQLAMPLLEFLANEPDSDKSKEAIEILSKINK